MYTKYYTYIFIPASFNKLGDFFKSKIIIFQNSFLHCLELVYRKNYFDLAKMFLLRLFKMADNQSAPGLNRVLSLDF